MINQENFFLIICASLIILTLQYLIEKIFFKVLSISIKL